MSNIAAKVFGKEEIPEGFSANDMEMYPRAHSFRKKQRPEEVLEQIMEQEEAYVREEINVL